MPKDSESKTTHATPAARAAAALRDILDDPTTPEVVKRTLLVSFQGLATAVSGAILAERGSEAARRAVSEAQTLAHLPRWILYADQHGITPQPGTLIFTKPGG